MATQIERSNSDTRILEEMRQADAHFSEEVRQAAHAAVVADERIHIEYLIRDLEDLNIGVEEYRAELARITSATSEVA